MAARLTLLADSALEALTERQRLQEMNAPTVHLDMKIRRDLDKLKAGLKDLEAEQNEMEQDSSISSEELASKEDIFVKLSKQHDRLSAMLEGVEPPSEREQLLSGNKAPSKSVRFTDIPEESSNGDLLQLQQRIMDDQDRDLDVLSDAISRQRELSLQIGDELEVHTQLLDETEEALDGTDRRLHNARKRLSKVSKTAKDHGSTFIIIALIIILLILIVIFKT